MLGQVAFLLVLGRLVCCGFRVAADNAQVFRVGFRVGFLGPVYYVNFKENTRVENSKNLQKVEIKGIFDEN